MEDKDLKNVLFSTPILMVLDFLLQHPETELNDTEIAARVEGARKSAVNLALRKLAMLGIVSRLYRGRMVFNKLVDSALTQQLKQTSNLMALQPLVDVLAPLCTKIVLFGSRSDGTHTSESDYDLLVVAGDATKVEKITRRSALADKVQLLIKSPEQMLTFHEDERVLFKEVGKGVVLWEKK